MKAVKGGENIKLGNYVAAMFVSASVEKTRNGEGKEVDSGYLLVAVGGRKGAFNIKYDISDADFVEFIDGLQMGDEILAGVRPSAFNGSVYYTLLSLQMLRLESVEAGPETAAPAVDKMEAAVKFGDVKK